MFIRRHCHIRTRAPSITTVERDLRAQGFDQVVEVSWPPRTRLDVHQHAFAAN
jgi:hypothetical protein